MTGPQREQRFCVCGWSVFGTDLERRNAMAAHRQSGEHERRIREQSVIDWEPEAPI